MKVLSRALNIIKKFKPDYLIVALGLDPAKGDPTGTWSFTHSNFAANGEMIGSLRLPTLVVQEGVTGISRLASMPGHFSPACTGHITVKTQ